MAFFDVSTGELVVRIVYDGLGTAGKTTNLRALHAAFPSRTQQGVRTPGESNTGRTLFFDWLDLAAGHLDDWPLRCQILTVPGQFVYASRRFHLLQEIDGVVLVCDSRPSGVEAGRLAAVFLKESLRMAGLEGTPIVLQANKQDVTGALSVEEVRAALPGLATEVIGAVATTGEGVRWTLLATLDLVRQRVRSIIQAQGVEALTKQTSTIEELHATLLKTDQGDQHSQALEAALAEMK